MIAKPATSRSSSISRSRIWPAPGREDLDRHGDPGVPARQTRSAALRELSPAADPASRTYAARLALSGDLDGVALGMSAVATARGDGRVHLQVPLTALHSREGAARVWVVDPATSTVRSQPIETGALLDDAVVVTRGLAGGETIVTAGANLLREGQKVRVTDAARADGSAR